MILGALGLPPDTQIAWPRVCGTDWAQGDDPQQALEFYAGRRLRSAGLFDARVPVAVANALIVAGMFWLAWRLWSPAGAFLGAMFVAFDPFYLGLSRLLHVDALPAGFMTLAIPEPGRFLDDRRRPAGDNRGRPGVKLGWLLLSSVFAGLAALGKSPSLIMGPFVLVVLAVWAVQQESHRVADGPRWMNRVLRRFLPAMTVWGLGWAITMFVLWPAMWVAPTETARNVLGAAVGYASEESMTPAFFLGHRARPRPLFYPVTLWFRLMPLTLLGWWRVYGLCGGRDGRACALCRG